MQNHNHVTEFESIVRNSKDGILVIDMQNIIRFANDTAAIFLNKTINKLIGQSFNNPMDNSLTEMTITRHDENPGTCEIQMTALVWEEEPASLITLHDITERKIYDKLRDDFISNVSHELRTPLTSIRESVAQVHDGILGNVTEDQKEYLSISIRNADRLQKIVNDLLDISRIESGKIELRKYEIPVNDVIMTALDELNPLIQKKQLNLEYSLLAEPVSIYGDKDRIIQVLNNLIGNAIKFTNEGKISVTLREDRSLVQCDIQDTGIGIDENDIPKIFDKFQIFSPDEQGSGLGLPIAREIVELHGGQVLVASSPGKGSCFSFTIPKYHHDLMLRDRLSGMIKYRDEPFILYQFKFHNIQDILVPLGNEYLQEMQDRVAERIKNMGNHTKLILSERNGLFITTKNQVEYPAVSKRLILQILKEITLDLTDSELDFSYAFARYPQEGQTADMLLNECHTNFVRYSDERLRKNILIVDDIVEITEQIQIILEHFGYENVHTANRGDAVFDMMSTARPDLIILDMKMPGMSGYEVIGRLKERHDTKDIPILIMSGYEVETVRFHDYINQRAILTLTKPVEPEILRKLVYYFL